jgi:hypothetical protein
MSEDLVTGFAKPFLPKKEAEKRRKKVESKMKKAGLKGYTFGLMPNLNKTLYAVTIKTRK